MKIQDLLTHAHSVTTIQSMRWIKFCTAIKYSATCHVNFLCAAFVYKQILQDSQCIVIDCEHAPTYIFVSIPVHTHVCALMQQGINNFKRLILMSQLCFLLIPKISGQYPLQKHSDNSDWAKSAPMFGTFENTEPCKNFSYGDTINAAENNEIKYPSPHHPRKFTHPGPTKSRQSQMLWEEELFFHSKHESQNRKSAHSWGTICEPLRAMLHAVLKLWLSLYAPSAVSPPPKLWKAVVISDCLFWVDNSLERCLHGAFSIRKEACSQGKKANL